MSRWRESGGGDLEDCCWAQRKLGNSQKPGELLETAWRLGENVSRLDSRLWCVGNADYFSPPHKNHFQLTFVRWGKGISKSSIIPIKFR